MGIPRTRAGMGTSQGQQNCRTCPERGRDVLQVRPWAPGSPCSTSARAQTPLAARSQLAPLGPALQLSSPGSGLPKTHYLRTAPLLPALAASECPSPGTRLLLQLGAGGTEGAPPSPSHVPSTGHGCDAASHMGSGARGCWGCPPASARGIPQGWPGARLRVWHKQRQPQRRLPRAPGILRAAAPLPQPPAPGSGRGTRAPAAAHEIGRAHV